VLLASFIQVLGETVFHDDRQEFACICAYANFPFKFGESHPYPKKVRLTPENQFSLKLSRITQPETIASDWI
jgi:hypothetical protein